MTFRLADEHTDSFHSDDTDNIVVERLTACGPLLDRAYELFQQIFDPSVLDPKSVYEDRMSPAAFLARDFYPCFAVAYVPKGNDKVIAGVLSSDLMWIEGDPKKSFLALGNIGTSPFLKSFGIKGVGSKLLAAVTDDAIQASEQDDRIVTYSVSEAEPASLGFWRKAGFRWPRGCNYLQPPLEFLEDGSPRYREVPETLLFAPKQAAADAIDSELVLKIIKTIFENWCLRGWRDVMPMAAIQRAEEYVMGNVLGRIAATMPSGRLPLVDQLPKADREE